jgi:hypothetical protein
MPYESFLLRVKYSLPRLFYFIEFGAHFITEFRFAHGISSALGQAELFGKIGTETFMVRALDIRDTEILYSFICSLPGTYLCHFHPHGFSRDELSRVLKRNSVLTYGLFNLETRRLYSYFLIKISPIGVGYFGRLVDPSLSAKGVGKFLGRYLLWQSAIVGLRAKSTISRANLASLKSHQRNGYIEALHELPNDYLLVEFKPSSKDVPPVLRLPET